MEGGNRQAMVLCGYEQCLSNYTLFMKHLNGKLIALSVYVDNIVINGNDNVEVQRLKNRVKEESKIKDLGPLKYFISIDVARSKDGHFIAEWKYVIVLLKETGMMRLQAL